MTQTKASNQKTAIILGNIGSPEEPSLRAVKRYLYNFLMDKHVITVFWPLRYILVRYVIIPLRSRTVTNAYKKIWFKDDAPLVYYTRQQAKLLENTLGCPVYVAMRYGKISIENALHHIAKTEIVNLVICPLYPQYALSSYESYVDECHKLFIHMEKSLKKKYHVTFVPPFYSQPEYIATLGSLLKQFLESIPEYNHILFSYHSIPEEHIYMVDHNSHCALDDDCCSASTEKIEHCYRAQSVYITKKIAEYCELNLDVYSIAYQSRINTQKWLKPYTDKVLTDFAHNQIQNIVVICPSFVVDCLETIEEMGIRNQELFVEHGGKKLFVVPCLNDNAIWIQALSAIIQRVCPSLV